MVESDPVTSGVRWPKSNWEIPGERILGRGQEMAKFRKSKQDSCRTLETEIVEERYEAQSDTHYCL